MAKDRLYGKILRFDFSPATVLREVVPGRLIMVRKNAVRPVDCRLSSDLSLLRHLRWPPQVGILCFMLTILHSLCPLSSFFVSRHAFATLSLTRPKRLFGVILPSTCLGVPCGASGPNRSLQSLPVASSSNYGQTSRLLLVDTHPGCD